MPFYNITPQESRGLCEFAERRQARRATTTTVMTFEGGSDAHTTARTQTDRVTDTGTSFLDAVVSVVEAVLLRYALTCVESADTLSSAAAATSVSEAAPSAATVVVERYYPFPSLLLHTPRKLVQLRRLHDASLHDKPGSGEDAALKLRDAYAAPAMPPLSLLAQHTAADHVASSVAPALLPAPLPYVAQEHVPAELRRNAAATVLHNPSLDSARPMVNVSLAAAPRDGVTPVASVQEMVQVVLQAEAAMVVTCAAAPCPARRGDAASAASDTACDVHAAPHDAAPEAPFLFSPDATSCVVVACRVTLHPVWQQRAARDAATVDNDPAARATARFLRRCASTAAAAMAHLDREAGVASMLQQLVWDSAVPAYLHAVEQHYATLLRHHTAATSSYARDAVTALARLLMSMAPSDAAPLLHVDWYVVGSVRMRRFAAPVLEEVMRAFFPSTSAPTPASPRLAPLAEEVPLASLLAQEAPTTQAPPAPAVATPSAGIETVAVAHRLREDGQCFWALNTTFQPWCVDTDAARRYAFPVTWGLLLSVATGHAWPATAQAGCRAYPVPEVRSMCTRDGYRWLTPLSTDRPLKLLCNAVPTRGSLAALLNVAAAAASPRQPLWRAFRGAPELGASSQQRCTVSVTLRSYVATLLSRQAAWRRRYAGPQPSSCSGDDGAADEKEAEDDAQRRCSGGAGGDENAPARVLPLIVRRRVPIPLAASAAPPGRDEADQVKWSAPPPDHVRALLAAPPAAFLQTSTTPHCEPPDFCALARSGLLWSQRVQPADVFVRHTDGLYID